MASSAGQPSLVPILPPAPHEPVAQAIILRLSESSLAALRELVRSGLLDKPGPPTVQLELNDAGPSALHVLNAPAPFPLSSTTFSPPLELLSRRANVASAPLHLAALAQTRYAVRHTDVSQSAKERLREGKEKEERDKRGRKIVQLDNEPSRAVTKGKGRATVSGSAATPGLGSRSGTPAGRSTSSSSRTGTDRLQPPGQQGVTAASSSGSRQGSRSPAPPVSRETSRPGSTPLRTRILQLLALGPLAQRQIVGKVRANESEVTRILSEIARPTSLNASLHRLLPQSYLQLEIFSWKQYSQADKAIVIAACEQAFDELRLPRDAEERRIIDPEWKGGSPLKQVLSAAAPAASASRTRDGSADSRASLERKKPRREASLRASASRSAVASPSSESEADAAPSSKKRRGSHAERKGATATDGSATSKEKRRRTIVPDDVPSEPLQEAKPKIHRPPASPLPDITSVPTPPATSLPSHIRPHETAIASSPAGTPVPHNAPSPPVASKTFKSAGKAKSKAKRNATPDFTSSEDEPDARGEVSGDDAHADGHSTSTRSPSPPLPPLDLPTSRPALRARFKDLFGRYEALNARLEKERQASEDLLAGRRQEGDGEVDRPWEDLKRDVRQRNAWHRELDEIKRRLA